jgi:cytochrome c peroxidase
MLAIPLLCGLGQADQQILLPLPAQAPAPEDNPTTEQRVALGRRLFFDPLLSGDNQMSCATCHAPEKGFGDGLPLGKGAGGRELSRNSQTVLNTGFFSNLFWDGRAASLEEQALGPITSPDEMAQDVDELVGELAAVPSYVAEFERVFGKPVNADDIARALATYQRSLIALNSPFDRYLAGDEDALSPAAKEGLALFRGDADCIRCHNGPLLSDGKFYRVGVNNTDVGRVAVTDNPEDRYRFRTPTLRNIAETGPYMHDGSMKSLFDVVEFYYRRVPENGPDGTSLDVESLLWQSYSEIELIVAFLESLSGELPAATR